MSELEEVGGSMDKVCASVRTQVWILRIHIKPVSVSVLASQTAQIGELQSH